MCWFCSRGRDAIDNWPGRDAGKSSNFDDWFDGDLVIGWYLVEDTVGVRAKN